MRNIVCEYDPQVRNAHPQCDRVERIDHHNTQRPLQQCQAPGMHHDLDIVSRVAYQLYSVHKHHPVSERTMKTAMYLYSVIRKDTAPSEMASWISAAFCMICA